ncbi:unnamed protein product [Didymodactylos carnosus]|uniref:Uncharacterized protein n=1 Tax=Didymodactylos carnosus TaxID=1234261 RepID=A0A814ICK8_9BILA|nr:unnamed protein product [Didymodactylos carnosus]CAF1097650.1 unnamed protein product [Didymodactylos carnosus]CAF3795078.1 unnamed protein product [Didymodactylos carnosus]CAF3859121.1 unnamed protein product [Didymodactylos carnosus]
MQGYKILIDDETDSTHQKEKPFKISRPNKDVPLWLIESNRRHGKPHNGGNWATHVQFQLPQSIRIPKRLATKLGRPTRAFTAVKVNDDTVIVSPALVFKLRGRYNNNTTVESTTRTTDGGEWSETTRASTTVSDEPDTDEPTEETEEPEIRTTDRPVSTSTTDTEPEKRGFNHELYFEDDE